MFYCILFFVWMATKIFNSSSPIFLVWWSGCLLLQLYFIFSHLKRLLFVVMDTWKWMLCGLWVCLPCRQHWLLTVSLAASLRQLVLLLLWIQRCLQDKIRVGYLCQVLWSEPQCWERVTILGHFLVYSYHVYCFACEFWLVDQDWICSVWWDFGHWILGLHCYSLDRWKAQATSSIEGLHSVKKFEPNVVHFTHTKIVLFLVAFLYVT